MHKSILEPGVRDTAISPSSTYSEYFSEIFRKTVQWYIYNVISSIMCKQFTVNKIQLESTWNLQYLEIGFKCLGMAHRYSSFENAEVSE